MSPQLPAASKQKTSKRTPAKTVHRQPGREELRERTLAAALDRLQNSHSQDAAANPAVKPELESPDQAVSVTADFNTSGLLPVPKIRSHCPNVKQEDQPQPDVRDVSSLLEPALRHQADIMIDLT